MNIADVIVVGAGNAALCAALSARENGSRVLVLEKAPEHLRGGNSYFTGGGFRFPYDGLEDIRALIPEMADEEANSIEIGSYPQSQMYDDIMRVTEGLSDADLIETLVTRAYPTVQWMRGQGLHWVLMYGRQSFEVGGKQHFLRRPDHGGGGGREGAGRLPVRRRPGPRHRHRLRGKGHGPPDRRHRTRDRSIRTHT